MDYNGMKIAGKYLFLIATVGSCIFVSQQFYASSSDCCDQIPESAYEESDEGDDVFEDAIEYFDDEEVIEEVMEEVIEEDDCDGDEPDYAQEHHHADSMDDTELMQQEYVAPQDYQTMEQVAQISKSEIKKEIDYTNTQVALEEKVNHDKSAAAVVPPAADTGRFDLMDAIQFAVLRIKALIMSWFSSAH